jgi:uncharacterized phiE125 gp8 family phage protein
MDFKVVTAVTTEPVTLAEARLQLHLTASDSTAEDSLITMWISASREVAEHYTGWALAPQTLEAAADAFPACGESFVLPMPPVASITHIKYTDEDGAEQTLSSGTYALNTYGDSRIVALTYDSEWPDTRCEPNAVRIRYATGYGTAVAEATPFPHKKAVRSAILLMVAWMNEHRGDEMNPDDIQPPAAKALLGTLKLWAR